MAGTDYNSFFRVCLAKIGLTMFGESINRSVVAVLCTGHNKISQFEICDARSFNATHVVTKMASQIHDSRVSTLQVKSDSSLTKHEQISRSRLLVRTKCFRGVIH